jgi:hypothetical protein
MFKEYDVVRLREARIADGLSKGAIGAVLIVHDAEPAAYLVEFCDSNGITLALLTLTDDDLLPSNGADPSSVH